MLHANSVASRVVSPPLTEEMFHENILKIRQITETYTEKNRKRLYVLLYLTVIVVVIVSQGKQGDF